MSSTSRDELNHELAVEGIKAPKLSFMDKIRRMLHEKPEKNKDLKMKEGIKFREGVKLFEWKAKESAKDKHWQDAHRYYRRLSQCFDILHEYDCAAEAIENSGNCAVNVANDISFLTAKDPQYPTKEDERRAWHLTAVERWREAAALYAISSQGTKAAECHRRIAELLMKHGQFDEAVKEFKATARHYLDNSMGQHAIEVLEPLSETFFRSGSPREAAEILFQCAECSLEVQVLRQSATKYVFHACLCSGARQLIPGTTTDDEYDENVRHMEEVFGRATFMDPLFDQPRRERMLITAVLDALRERDLKAFDEAVKEFKTVHKVDGFRKECIDALRNNVKRFNVEKK